MVTPYDWQEAIGHRAQFVESRLASGIPVAAVSTDEGIVAGTFRRQTSKLYEIYDHLMYAAIGQQSDIESLRVAAIDFAHREGYQRSEQDVTIQRIVTAMSQPIKDAFANFSSAPWVGKALFMEAGVTVADDRYYCIEYDGDYVTDHGQSSLAGTSEQAAEVIDQIKKAKLAGLRADKVAERLMEIVDQAVLADETLEKQDRDGLQFEAVLLKRQGTGDRRFERLTPDEL